MGCALEIISYAVTSVNGTRQAATIFSGDKPDIRKSRSAKMLQISGNASEDYAGRILSPNLHDNQNGIEFLQPLFGSYKSGGIMKPENLIDGDVLNVSIKGYDATLGSSFASLHHYYEDDSIFSYFIDFNEYRIRSVYNVDRIVNCPVLWVDGTGYVSLTQLSSLLTPLTIKSEKYYAITGVSSTNCEGVITFKGKNFPFRFGCPLVNIPYSENRFFSELSKDTGLRTIPVFYGYDFGSIYLEFAPQGSYNDTARLILHLTELSS